MLEAVMEASRTWPLCSPRADMQTGGLGVGKPLQQQQIWGSCYVYQMTHDLISNGSNIPQLQKCTRDASYLRYIRTARASWRYVTAKILLESWYNERWLVYRKYVPLGESAVYCLGWPEIQSQKLNQISLLNGIFLIWFSDAPLIDELNWRKIYLQEIKSKENKKSLALLLMIKFYFRSTNTHSYTIWLHLWFNRNNCTHTKWLSDLDSAINLQ